MTMAATKKITKKSPTRGKRVKKDPNAPKRALSSYMFFAKDERAKIVSENPELKTDVATVGKMIGEAWSKLSPAAKGPYEKKAQADKERYAKQKEAYLKEK